MNVHPDYLNLLKTYQKQVIPIRYESCPLEWKEYSRNPRASVKMGLEWKNSKNHFCGPYVEGSADNKYLIEDEEDVNERVEELKNQINKVLNLSDKEEDVVSERRKKIRELREKHEKTVKDSHKSKQKKMSIKLLKQIYEDAFVEDPEGKAETLYAQSEKAVKDREASFDTKMQKTKIGEILVPSALVDEENRPLKRKLAEWWRKFRYENVEDSSLYI